MISINNVEYRNLEEQVQKNKEDIAAHYNMDRVLADFGIRIIGRVDTPEDLPDPDTFTGNYGDAYAVGLVQDDTAASPFTFYIWTRPDPNAGHYTSYWFDLGELAIVGPQGLRGEPGPIGPAGTRGNLWYSGSAIPANATAYNIGDLYLRTNGDIYQVALSGNNKIWNKITNIIGPIGPAGEEGPQGDVGPEGPAGKQGPKGDTGALCRIVGSITSINELPTPTQAIRYDGYTQTIGEETHLWIITGDTSLQWMDIGVVGGAGGAGGTNVIINGVVQDEFDATNVLMNPLTSSTGFLYQSSASGTYTTKTGQQQITTASVDTTAPALRHTNGAMDVIRNGALTNILSTINRGETVPDRTPTTSTDGALRSNQATPRGYVDTLVQYKIDELRKNVDLTLENSLGSFINKPQDLPIFSNALLGMDADGTTKIRNLNLNCTILNASGTLAVQPNTIYMCISSSGKASVKSISPPKDILGHTSRSWMLIFASSTAVSGTQEAYGIISGGGTSAPLSVNQTANSIQIFNNGTATTDTVYVYSFTLTNQ